MIDVKNNKAEDQQLVLSNGKVQFSIDYENELEITLAHCEGEAERWLSKAEAEQLLAFLSKWLRPAQGQLTEQPYPNAFGNK